MNAAVTWLIVNIKNSKGGEKASDEISTVIWDLIRTLFLKFKNQQIIKMYIRILFFSLIISFLSCKNTNNNDSTTSMKNDSSQILNEIDNINEKLKKIGLEATNLTEGINTQNRRIDDNNELINDILNRIDKAKEFQPLRTESEKAKELNELNSYLNSYKELDYLYKEQIEKTINKKKMLDETSEKLKNDLKLLKSKL